MSEANENINASSTKMPSADLSGMDTKTRKTVRLGVAQQGLTPNTATVISDPLSGRDTDTSNLEILDDTQTRRTVKIKPIAAAARTTVKLNVDEGATGAAPVAGDDTQTRKTLVLKPISAATPRPQITPNAERTPAAGELGATGTMRLKKPIPRPMGVPATPAAPAATAAATPATPVAQTPVAPVVNDGDDTATRKADIKKPEVKEAVVLPTQVADETKDGDDTATRKSTVQAPKPAPGVELPGSGNEDQTIKLTRPQRPAIPPRPGVPGVATPAAAAPKIPALKPIPGKTATPAAAPATPAAAPATPAAPKTVAPSVAPATPTPAPAAPEKKADDDLVLAPSMSRNGRRYGRTRVLF